MSYDLRGFTVARNGTASLTVPVWSITGQIVDSRTGALKADFTGANAISFPQALGLLTAAQQDEVIGLIVSRLLERRFGL